MTMSISGIEQNHSISCIDADKDCLGNTKDESKSSETSGDSSTSFIFRDLNVCNAATRPSVLMSLNDAATTTSLNDRTIGMKKKDKKHNSNNAMNKLTKTEKSILSEQGYTRGLLDALETNRNEFLYSIWITDNSTSMNVVDGHRIDPVLCNQNTDNGNNIGGAVTFKNCSRWEEIQQTLDYHAQMAAIVKAPTMFHFVNEPQSSDSNSERTQLLQQFTISDTSNSNSNLNVKHRYEDLEVAQRTIKAIKPSGKCTPLTETIRNVRDNIIPKLLNTTTTSSGSNKDSKRIVLVIATDGILADVDEGIPATEAAKDEFIQTIQSLKDLPVWIVVRLCTDDNNVVDYWNNINLDGIELDVLDDYVSEAKEVYAHNKWLNYGLPLHRLREMGFYDDVFDLLDERTLNRREIIDFCTILLGKSVMSKAPNVYPNKDTDDDDNDLSCRSHGASQRVTNVWDEFCYFVEAQLRKEIELWNPIRKNVESWINIKELRKISDDQQQPIRRLINRRTLFRSSSASRLNTNNKDKNQNQTTIKSPSPPSTRSNKKVVSKLMSSLVQFVVRSPMKKRNKLKITSPTITSPTKPQQLDSEVGDDNENERGYRRFSVY
jgi:hypothetical protein